MFTRFGRNLKEIFERRYVLWQLVRQQLVLKYRRTALGYLWTLVNPVLMMSVSAVVFSKLFGTDLRSYAVFLFAGMIPWNCFSAMVVQSSQSFILNEALIRKVYLPKMIFPFSVGIAVLIDSMLSFGALFLLILLVGGKFSLALFFIPVAYLMLFLFASGIAFIIATVTAAFRDVQHMIHVLMQALFFLSPVLYGRDRFGEGRMSWVVDLNPITPFIDLFRYPLHGGVFPPAASIGGALIVIGVFLGFGLWFLLSNEKRIVYWL